jgi:hypothetical protein
MEILNSLRSIFNPHAVENNAQIFRDSIFASFLAVDTELDFKKVLIGARHILAVIDWDETKQTERLCIKPGINDHLDSLKDKYKKLGEYLTVVGKFMVG